MYEENRRFSWTNLFIKLIIVVIFILFTIWLLSLTIKNGTSGLANSLDVLTDGIFAENVEKMKEVGKSYFTTERLPEKVGDIKTLTLARMYDENLILELKDKNGNACSAKNSYVTIEKMEYEYQMKVYLECGEVHDYIKVIMGCYNYCNKDICEKKEDPTPVYNNVEYEYSRTSGGSWGPYGSWSEWSKVSVDKTNYREVETKTVRESYSYDKEIVETKYVGEADCPSLNDYYLTGSQNGICSYTKTNTSTTNPLACASTYNGYDLVSQNGFTCNYSNSTTSTVNPVACASTYNGYNLVSQNGFTCDYSKTIKETTDPVSCPSTTSDGYTLVSQNGFTCNYTKKVKDVIDASYYYDYDYDDDDYDYSSDYSDSSIHVPGPGVTTPSCSGCGDIIVPTFRGVSYNLFTNNLLKLSLANNRTSNIWSDYEDVGNESTNLYAIGRNIVISGVSGTRYTCPSGYSLSGTKCYKYTTLTKVTTVGCPSGYTKSGNSCVKSRTYTTTTTVGCPSGYTKSGNVCVKNNTSTIITTVGCPSGYTKSGSICVKTNTRTTTRNATCGTGEKMTNGKCYKDVKTTTTVIEDRNVTYYRYRVREYLNGNIEYKWSTSNNDRDLLDAGYKLTGRTRNIGGK